MKICATSNVSVNHRHYFAAGYQNRTMEEDLLSMFCADGLALARSTLVSLTGFHSKAKRVYGPHQCNPQFKQLALLRPEVQVRVYDCVCVLVCSLGLHPHRPPGDQ